MNNVINFEFLKKSPRDLELTVKEIGNINITVFMDETTHSPVYYMLPDKKELIPIVDLLDDTLTNHSFKLSQTLKIEKIN